MTVHAQVPSGRPIVWQPDELHLQHSRLKRFMARHGLAEVGEMMERSTADIASFWEGIFQDLAIKFYEPCRQVVDLSRGIQWPRWCVGAKLNIVHISARRHWRAHARWT